MGKQTKLPETAEFPADAATKGQCRQRPVSQAIAPPAAHLTRYDMRQRFNGPTTLESFQQLKDHSHEP
ncbi:hypothetical protein, partial [Mesorhizobium sp. M7A.F.Ca.US.002.01.1.1]|uniref:hypothetical protein n=1 Tax=Mesorhizobium sp. M7A.F.Ca.US.002.01.1.1 TaxID=2496700 RepID=UPI0019D42752